MSEEEKKLFHSSWVSYTQKEFNLFDLYLSLLHSMFFEKGVLPLIIFYVNLSCRVSPHFDVIQLSAKPRTAMKQQEEDEL